MFIPKVFFLGLASSVGIGSVVSLSSIAGGDASNIWRINSQTSFPLFTCSFANSKISISLKLKNGVGNLQDNQPIEFWAEGQIRGETINPVNLSSDTTGAKVYKLTIFETTSSSRLEVTENSGGNLQETLTCKPEVFKVTQKTTTLGLSPAWVKEFKNLSLTLEKCDVNSNKEECSINIGSDVGLGWKEGFEPKVII